MQLCFSTMTENKSYATNPKAVNCITLCSTKGRARKTSCNIAKSRLFPDTGLRQLSWVAYKMEEMVNQRPQSEKNRSTCDLKNIKRIHSGWRTLCPAWNFKRSDIHFYTQTGPFRTPGNLFKCIPHSVKRPAISIAYLQHMYVCVCIQ